MQDCSALRLGACRAWRQHACAALCKVKSWYFKDFGSQHCLSSLTSTPLLVMTWGRCKLLRAWHAHERLDRASVWWPCCTAAVREAFVRLHDRGLVYRGSYLVNWSPRMQTAVSDLEARLVMGHTYFAPWFVMGVCVNTALAAAPRAWRACHLSRSMLTGGVC